MRLELLKTHHCAVVHFFRGWNQIKNQFWDYPTLTDYWKWLLYTCLFFDLNRTSNLRTFFMGFLWNSSTLNSSLQEYQRPKSSWIMAALTVKLIYFYFKNLLKYCDTIDTQYFCVLSFSFKYVAITILKVRSISLWKFKKN